MTLYRSQKNITIGSEPPQSVWTFVSGDTASFKMYVEDDNGDPLALQDWNIAMAFNRESSTSNPVLQVTPQPGLSDGPGEFTVFLAYDETPLLQTGDTFDIELSLQPGNAIVWTVLRGTLNVIESITN